MGESLFALGTIPGSGRSRRRLWGGLRHSALTGKRTLSATRLVQGLTGPPNWFGRRTWLLKRFWLTLCAYVLTALLGVGDILKPLLPWIYWPGGLGAPLWQALVIASVGAAALIFRVPERAIATELRPAAFVALAMLSSILCVGLYADAVRMIKIAEFKADYVIQNSFFISIRRAPRDFQFFVHSAALRDCTPYAWSYREMNLFPLPLSVAKNVLPSEWIEMCSMRAQRP